ncbi:hypothetical protein EDC04DRAFT_2891181 [Pisolithus marmoratus]|nr:hypothetical protein EDC04DRAFT_2891181 [Pisolithus marmoratus]
MAKRCLETVEDAQQHVGKHAHDIPTHEPDLPETDHGLLDHKVDEEVTPIPDLNGPVNEDMFPFTPDHSDAEINTLLDKNFSLHVHDAPNPVQHPPDDEETPISVLPTIQHQQRTCPVVDIEALTVTAILPSMKQTMCFIKSLKNVSLDDPITKLSEESLKRLCNPLPQPISIESMGTCYSIATYQGNIQISNPASLKLSHSGSATCGGANL